jgi:hypothetical protein
MPYLNEGADLPHYDSSTIRRFLLRSLPEEKRIELEAEMFRNDEFFESIAAAEDDLICEYLEGQMPVADRAAFLAAFGAGTKIDAMQAFLSTVAPPPPRVAARPLSLSLLAAAAVIAIAAAGGALWESAQNRNSNRELQAALARNESLQRSLAEFTRTGATVHFALNPGLQRDSAELSTFEIPESAKTIELALNITASNVAGITGTLQHTDGGIVWSSRTLRADGNAVTASIPSAQVADGEYELTLQDATNRWVYGFAISRATPALRQPRR